MPTPVPGPVVPTAPARPPSPWPGSSHADRYRWQLDGVRSLPEAAGALRALAAELQAAHAAGWALVEPVERGHLVAARPSRRTRSRTGPVPLPPDAAPPALRVRLRLVDEPPAPGEERLDVRRVPRSPVLDAGLHLVSGSPVPDAVLAEVARQVRPAELGDRRWALARARVGPAVDLVADGSALRVHAVGGGELVRTTEALAFSHAADGARDLPSAAAALLRLARVAGAMAAAGGVLRSVDDGLLLVGYGPP